jgi:hypothetical protein
MRIQQRTPMFIQTCLLALAGASTLLTLMLTACRGDSFLIDNKGNQGQNLYSTSCIW